MSEHALTIHQGETFTRTLTFADGGLTGASAQLQVRRFYNSSTAVVDIDTDDGIEITSDTTMTLTIDADTTAAMTGPGVYDLVITYVDGTKEIALHGPVRLVPQVTR
ncbi:MAG: hypothetical protein KDB40_10970 [Acidimicrobiales bacterium]|nr:hypothetical protein [Acidimicrobiales bacterium]MCB9393800.1 hypothetical protein [Acidimicrobiaceae bacterium]